MSSGMLLFLWSISIILLGAAKAQGYGPPPSTGVEPGSVESQPTAATAGITSGGETPSVPQPATDCLPLSVLFPLFESMPPECIERDQNGCETIAKKCSEGTALVEPTVEVPNEANESPASSPAGQPNSGEEVFDGSLDCFPLALVFPLLADVPPDCIVKNEAGCEVLRPDCESAALGTSAGGKPGEKPVSGLGGDEPPQVEKSESQPVPGADAHDYCCWWAQNNECNSNPYWMRPQCQKSCGTIGCTVDEAEACPVSVNVEGCKWQQGGAGAKPSQGAAPGGAPAGVNDAYAGAKLATDRAGAPRVGVDGKRNGANGGCRDNHSLCNYWASVRECEINKAVMERECPQACGVC